MPAPAFSAPPTASTAAPVYRSLPATIPTTPLRYLSVPVPGRGSMSRTDARSSAPTSGSGRYGPSPMSTSSTRPAYEAPGSTSSPVFHAPIVTVTPARTALPSTRPVDASTPLGTSTATTGAPARPSISASPAYGSRNAPETPIPTSPSTISSAFSTASRTSPENPPAPTAAGPSPPDSAEL